MKNKDCMSGMDEMEDSEMSKKKAKKKKKKMTREEIAKEGKSAYYKKIGLKFE